MIRLLALALLGSIAFSAVSARAENPPKKDPNIILAHSRGHGGWGGWRGHGGGHEGGHHH